MACAMSAGTQSPTPDFWRGRRLKCAFSAKKSLREKNLRTSMKDALSPLVAKCRSAETNDQHMIEYVVSQNPDDRKLARASQILRNGGLVCFPTETNWMVV